MTGFFDRLILCFFDLWLQWKARSLVGQYRKLLGCRPRLGVPVDYTEQMLWRKVLDRNPQFIVFCDKLATKAYIRERCPGLALPETLWIGTDSDQIPSALLEGDIFVKANHGWSFNQHIRHGKFDRLELKRRTQEWLRSIHGQEAGEWAYSGVEPRIFVETSVADPGRELLEYNIRACDGRLAYSTVSANCKTPSEWTVYLDMEGNKIYNFDAPDGCPVPDLVRVEGFLDSYRQAVKWTRELSLGVDYVRYDFFWNGKELYGGEITVYPNSGNSNPPHPDLVRSVAQTWDLSRSHFLKTQHRGWRRVYAGALRREIARKNR